MVVSFNYDTVSKQVNFFTYVNIIIQEGTYFIWTFFLACLHDTYLHMISHYIHTERNVSQITSSKGEFAQVFWKLVLPAAKNDHGTKEAWALNGTKEPMQKKKS